MNIEDDNDSSDEDYNPDEEKTSDVEEDNEVNPLKDISKTRKRHIETIYNDLNSSENEFVHNKLDNSLSKTIRYKKMKKLKTNSVKVNTKAIDALSIIFGTKKAKNMLFKSESGNGGDGHDGDNELVNENKKKKAKSKSNSIKEQAQKLVKNIQTSNIVTEKKKFAGQEIEVKIKQLGSGEANKPQKSSLDQMLSDLNGPKTISTVTKSSYDWDTFKDAEKLNDDLNKASQDGYLNKQDFLNRCDVRSFEMERDERLRKSVIAAGSNPKA